MSVCCPEVMKPVAPGKTLANPCPKFTLPGRDFVTRDNYLCSQKKVSCLSKVHYQGDRTSEESNRATAPDCQAVTAFPNAVLHPKICRDFPSVK